MSGDVIKRIIQTCEAEIKDDVQGLTDGTDDIFEGRKEFAAQILILINTIGRLNDENYRR
jgi:hypothetical protein